MKKIAITGILYFILFHLNAQDNSSKDYVITNELDTLYGSIKEGTDHQLVSYIIFKKDNQPNEMKYLASELTGFRFEYGRTFQSFAVKNDSSINDEYVFAKRIVDGKISVFSSPIKQKNDQPDFIIINNHTRDTVHITQPEKIKILEDGREYTAVTATYIGKIESIKGHSINERPSKIRYSESAIKKNIVSYNKHFGLEYPPNVYKPKFSYFNDLAIGLPISGDYSSSDIAFRISYFRNKYSHERATYISFMQGVSYRYWEDTNSTVDTAARYSIKNYRRQVISAIPLGFNLHHTFRIFIPYIYAGVGIGLLVDTNSQVYEYEYLGSQNEYFIFPTINVGAGLKIKLKSSAIFIEVTPTRSSGFYGNVGFSF